MVIYTPSLSSEEASRKLTLLCFGNELPQDDLQSLYRQLYNRSKDIKYQVLARFVAEATSAIRDEVQLLPTHLRHLVPDFDTVLGLANHPELRKSPLCGSFEGVLLCVAELAAFIGFVWPMLWLLSH